MKDRNPYIDGTRFHSEIRRVYFGSYGWALNKKNEEMAHVVYEPAHENTLFEDNRRGNGKDFATWIFSEEPGLEENLFESDFELMIDASLEPNASIGLHTHHNTEEIYYIIEGKILMTTLDRDGNELQQELFSGDAHFVRRGQSHYGTAGPEGVRFVAVAMRVLK